MSPLSEMISKFLESDDSTRSRDEETSHSQTPSGPSLSHNPSRTETGNVSNMANETRVHDQPLSSDDPFMISEPVDDYSLSYIVEMGSKYCARLKAEAVANQPRTFEEQIRDSLREKINASSPTHSQGLARISPSNIAGAIHTGNMFINQSGNPNITGLTSLEGSNLNSNAGTDGAILRASGQYIDGRGKDIMHEDQTKFTCTGLSSPTRSDWHAGKAQTYLRRTSSSLQIRERGEKDNVGMDRNLYPIGSLPNSMGTWSSWGNDGKRSALEMNSEEMRNPNTSSHSSQLSKVPRRSHSDRERSVAEIERYIFSPAPTDQPPTTVHTTMRTTECPSETIFKPVPGMVGSGDFTFPVGNNTSNPVPAMVASNDFTFPVYEIDVPENNLNDLIFVGDIDEFGFGLDQTSGCSSSQTDIFNSINWK